jgi:hypothetical protein
LLIQLYNKISKGGNKMKYSVEYPLPYSLDTVMKYLDNPGFMKEWQPTLIDYEFLSETPRQKGQR